MCFKEPLHKVFLLGDRAESAPSGFCPGGNQSLRESRRIREDRGRRRLAGKEGGRPQDAVIVEIGIIESTVFAALDQLAVGCGEVMEMLVAAGNQGDR